MFNKNLLALKIWNSVFRSVSSCDLCVYVFSENVRAASQGKFKGSSYHYFVIVSGENENQKSTYKHCNIAHINVLFSPNVSEIIQKIISSVVVMGNPTTNQTVNKNCEFFPRFAVTLKLTVTKVDTPYIEFGM